MTISNSMYAKILLYNHIFGFVCVCILYFDHEAIKRVIVNKINICKVTETETEMLFSLGLVFM